MHIERLTLSLIHLAVLAPLLLAAEKPEPVGATRAAIIKFEGMIEPIGEHCLYRRLEEAEAEGFDLLIIEIDSPGGFVTTTLKLADELRDISWAKTVAYIPREALSGAAIMALACDQIVMGPMARIGDAGPIVQGEDAMFRHASEKIRSDLVRRMRDFAERTGRPPALAEAMVDADVVVYQVKNRNTGQQTYMSDVDIESSPDSDQWEKGPLVQESRKGLFLEVNGSQAVELGLADLSVNSRQELTDQFGIAENNLTVMESNWVDVAVLILNSFPGTLLLIIIGILALYVEMSAPGISIGGLLAGLCFGLFFWSRFLGGTSGWLEVLLFMSGIVFVGVELFVIPGFGLAGISGVLLIISSLIMASQDFLVPQNPMQMRTLIRSITLVSGAGFGILGGAVLLSRYFGAIPVLNRLALQPPAGVSASDDGPQPTAASLSGVTIGDDGVADSPLRPAGRAQIGGSFVDVVTDGSFVDRGRPVRIIQISGNRIVVREVLDDDLA